MMTWILANWDNILAAYGGLVALCTTIVKLTPNTKDDAIVSKVIKVLDFFSTAFTKADAEKLKK